MDHGHSHGGEAAAGLLAHDHVGDVPVKGAALAAGGSRGRAKASALNKAARAKLLAAGGFCILFMIGEVIGGYLAGSLAIMTDAAHLLSDVAGFLISLFAIWLAERPPSAQATWGYHRVEVFGALGSVILIWLLTGVLVYEAIQRIINPEPVDGKIMFITATAGLGVNLVMMKILHQAPGGGHGHSHGGGHGHSHGGGGHGGHETNLNVRAAFIHVLGDLIQSVGVMLAAAIIWAVPSAHIADPISTFVFAILVLGTTIGVMRQGLVTLLNSVPAHISLSTLAAELAALPGVANVHDLHVWSFGTGRVAMTVHLVADDPPSAYRGALALAQKHGIGHSTVQTEQCGSGDVDACWAYNEHIDDCAIDVAAAAALVADGAVAKPGHYGHSHAGGGDHGHAHDDHGHAHGDHGHVHGDHGHAHAHGGHGAEEQHHGHSHDGGAHHGHAHGDHGHAHAGASDSPRRAASVRLDRPLPSARHEACGSLVSGTGGAAAVPAQSPAGGFSPAGLP